MGKEINSIKSILSRYLVLLLLSIGNLWLVYAIFSPLTIYGSYGVLKLVYVDASLAGDIITYSDHSLQIISACIAGAAYFLLFILNLSTPMSTAKRAKSLVFLIGTFFIVNILRIIIFAILFAHDYASIDILHKFTWYVLSTLLVIALWFVTVRVFDIDMIPMYSDFKYLKSQIK